ncbi:NAD(P)-dependent dehydrogenase (short-subunit alcohol dehydrogenase family) [Haloactinomyces albus]|uniref:NAD(P)-dependent dehydrogenase (Short-subunit alcohol dehydrogenase family) n=1 Tax=Haloactinomyces albus TaxID=1352928 RepID=A0AAE3ZHG5_9ACTN|nr:NAD(P)-dependent dehydrogenase (short-subunit alcohol dehydrogenase family) [Haloactinomyces albus]
MTARGQNGERLTEDLTNATGNPNVTAISCDLASLAEIGTAANEVRRRVDAQELPPLKGFLGNAGLQMTSRTHATVDGYETTFAVNVLANYYFVRLLWNHFTTPARITMVGSDTHFGDLRHNLGMVPAPRWESTRQLAMPREGSQAHSVAEGRTAYSTSKLAVTYLVHALARRLPDGVDVYTFNPGYVPGTGLVRDAGPVIRALSRTLLHGLRATPLALSPTTAGNLLADAAGGSTPGDSGTYIDRRKVAASAPESYDREREEELWAAAAELCALPAEPTSCADDLSDTFYESRLE